MCIQSSSVLVELSISTWTGRKQDKQVSEEIDAAKHTKAKAGNYMKRLLAGTPHLDDVQKLVTGMRIWHYEQTLPWSDNGARLLPMKNFFEYKATLSGYEAQFNNAVDDFLAIYPTLVSAAAFQLGDLFNYNEYPDVDKIRDKFRFRYVFLPVPDTKDFRIDMDEQQKGELENQYKTFYDNKLSEAMKDAWDRLYECVAKMSDKLADAPTPRVTKDGENYTQIFRDTLITNAVDLCGLLTRLNVTEDPKLEAIRRRLESAVLGVEAKEVRENNTIRLDVKAKVDEILTMF